MESAKIPHHHHRSHHHHHHHQQVQLLSVHPQDQLLGSSSSTNNLSDYSPVYVAPSPHLWTSNNSILLNSTINGSFDSSDQADLSSRNPRFEHHDNTILVPSLSSSSSIITQDLSFNHWLLANAAGRNIKQQLSNRSCPNLSEMISSSSPSSSIEDDPNVNLLLSTLSSSGSQNSRFQSSCSPEELIMYSSSSSVPSKRPTFSQIYPTINISNFSITTQTTSLANSAGAFDVATLRPLDLLNPARSLQEHQVGNYPNVGGYDDAKPSFQQPLESSYSNNHNNNTTAFNNGGGEEKSRSSNNSEPKAATKRPRLESNRPSCPPLKVRKEKLGDRIAALQQLVAPFGKTDTASVLMEAFGYIKFLQNQVEVFCTS
ncbi:OLC1v1018059C5 [Oldenlandia corymbosa var. corymbosa]|uniref:OLC1v1018059C5 n=1 Tax=Oldenlandia corymbosa var. corymbosa TaxID=529605 RepID=A0AAV1EAQ9_OLDCO|nr:OLC1v1018059C5 [Oldenlandia corymbosa var. corymbosa]